LGQLTAVFLVAPAAAQGGGQPASIPRFQVEIWRGYASLNPDDLNLAVAHDDGVEEFLFDDRYPWLLGTGAISSWDQSGSGAREELGQTNPTGLRVKYYLKRWFAVSLGYEYFSMTERSSIQHQYISVPYPNRWDIERINVELYSLSAKGQSPLAGVHFLFPISSWAGAEFFLSGGPLSVEIRYEQNQTYGWWFDEGGGEALAFQSETQRIEEGDGTGLAIEAGGRLNFRIYKGLGLFLEGSYARQKVDDLSGTGSETRDGVTQHWEGEWQVRETELVARWGSRTLKYPTSFPGDGPDGASARNFELDLSGFRLRVGVLFRF
jgi:hypothetical protein